MPDIDALQTLVVETFPHIPIKKFTLLGEGKSATVCLANDEIVFKIPLPDHVENAEWQRNEPTVLQFLEGKLDIQVPKILCAGTSPCGLYIFGMTLLHGTPFSYELCDTYDKETSLDIQRQLGKIVRNIHTAGGHDPSWLTTNTQETAAELLADFHRKFNPTTRAFFLPHEVEFVEEIAKRYEYVSTHHPVKPVLCHHDLHYYNLMFDEENKRISGVLDFGCAGYGEPAQDWHYYFDAKYVLEGYGDTADEFFMDRQRFHALSHMLYDFAPDVAEEQRNTTLGYIRQYIFAV